MIVVRALPEAGSTPYPQLGKDLDAALRLARTPRSHGSSPGRGVSGG
jgi:hypothetical protein